MKAKWVLGASLLCTSLTTSLLRAQNLDRQLGQLIMVAGYSNKGSAEMDRLEAMVRAGDVGGIIWMQGGPERQRAAIQRLQRAASVPLMMAQDAEWGAAMRLDSVPRLPWPLTLGATGDTALARRYGEALATESRMLGIHVNFSPVVDVNTNPRNPIIGQRALGSDPRRVLLLANAQIRGMERARVMACVKHFPGHGDTETDSHHTLPTVARSRAELKRLDLAPFKATFDAGVGSVMVAHVNVPALDPSGTPASLSKAVVTHWMRDSLGYQGLSFTDALNMKGVAQDLAPGELEVRAFEAGHDVLLFVGSPRAAITALKAAVRSGRIDSVEVHRRYVRVLEAKKRWNCASPLPAADYDGQRARWSKLSSEIYAAAFTEIKGMKDVQAIEFVGEGTPPQGLKPAQPGDTRVVLIFGPSTSTAWKKGAWTDEMKAALARHQAAGRKVGVVHLGNPYGLRGQSVASLAGLWVGYENTPETRQLAVSVVRGEHAATGTLPVNGIPAPKMLQAVDLKTAGFSADLDRNVAAVVQRGLDAKAYPGCQVLVARHGEVVLHKGYGTLDGTAPVTPETVYDIASVTKIMASVPLLLEAYDEEGPGFLVRTMDQLLPELRGTAIGRAKVQDVLAHQSGLPAWLPFYTSMLRQDGGYDHHYLRTVRDTVYRLPVAPGIWAAEWMHDTLIARIARAPLGPKSYEYSDLGYYLFQRYLERRDGRSMERQLEDDWYGPLGAELCFNPQPSERIAPTENDRRFRKQQLRGSVHDQGAALMGGVAGHAGVFGTAEGVAQMMQLFLDGGKANGLRFASEAALNRFTACLACDQGNRRGLGFDKRQLSGGGPACLCASRASFGHTGFTGTFAWADPETGIVLVFLSNRVYPDASVNKLAQMGIRTDLQQVVYSALL
jgi:beta-glucosidase-like glycosyl hydrolase/CubicO group peptidase (beta-lactamase class C family)